MTSQIRVDEITNRSGLGTVTIYDNGFEFTGVTTFTENVDIEGNLTIGGVLTYEDTTNIDSVGVITARAGVHVTGGNLAVGHNNPSVNLHAKETGGPNIVGLFETNQTDAFISFRASGTTASSTVRIGAEGDDFRAFINGAERLRITSAGNVGINRPIPSAALDVESATDQTVLRLRNNGGNNTRLLFSNKAVGVAEIFYQGDFRFVDDENSDSERLRITSAGLVGIGTDNPATNLDVNGSLQLRAAGNYTTYATRIYSRLDSTHCTVIESYLNSSTAFEMMGSYADGGGTNPRVVLGAGGQKVGINETAPDRTLHVNSGAIDTALKLESTDTEVSLELTDNTGSSYIGGGGSYLNFYSGGNERLRISSIGHLTTQGNNQGNPVGIEIRNNNTNGYSHAELSLTSQNATTSKIWCDVPNAGMRLNYNGGTSVKINQSGNLVMANGAGIDFSATANSSGSMSSELLDDYEEGTWTPNFAFTGGSTGLTYSYRGGVYTRVGRLVTCYCMIVLSNKGSSTGNVLVSGLPYTATDLVSATSIEGGGHAVYQDNTVGTHVGPIQAAVINSQSYFDMYRVTSTNPGHSDVVTNGNVANNSSYRFVLQYTAV